MASHLSIQTLQDKLRPLKVLFDQPASAYPRWPVAAVLRHASTQMPPDGKPDLEILSIHGSGGPPEDS